MAETKAVFEPKEVRRCECKQPYIFYPWRGGNQTKCPECRKTVKETEE